MTDNSAEFDAFFLVSFGGPEGKDDVMPYLENVLRGKNVPRERMLEVAEHYYHFDGISPINQQNRDLLEAVKEDFAKHDIDLPVYWGNRNWHPMIVDSMEQMKQDGIQKALSFFTNGYSCYSGCRQYRENIADAQASIGEGAPEVHKTRMFFNHPAYIEASVDRVRDALNKIPQDRQGQARILFTAHSIPNSMADYCKYSTQLTESCKLIMESLPGIEWELVYQSRSGPPQQPWLEPDVCDRIEELHEATQIKDLVIHPVGFVSDHMEVMFDLDTEAKELCDKLDISMQRSLAVGVHPKFIEMIRELVLERIQGAEKKAIGEMPPNWDVCPQDCCLYKPARRPAAKS